MIAERTKEIESGIQGMLCLLESDPSLGPIPIDPYSMGIGEMTVEDLSEAEREILWRVACSVLKVGFDMLSGNFLEEYIEERGDQRICVTVYKTGLSNVFLQILKFPDGQTRWLIGMNRD